MLADGGGMLRLIWGGLDAIPEETAELSRMVTPDRPTFCKLATLGGKLSELVNGVATV